MFVNWLAYLTYLNTANSDIILFEEFFRLDKGKKPLVLHVFKGTLIAKELKIFHSFHLFAILRSI